VIASPNRQYRDWSRDTRALRAATIFKQESAPATNGKRGTRERRGFDQPRRGEPKTQSARKR
jgi:hypothetical protein